MTRTTIPPLPHIIAHYGALNVLLASTVAVFLPNRRAPALDELPEYLQKDLGYTPAPKRPVLERTVLW